MTKKYRCIDATGDFQKVLKKGVIYKGKPGSTEEYIDIEIDDKWNKGWFKSRFIEVKDDRKIIGYKSPIDLFGGYVKKGTIYGKSDKDHKWYSPQSNGTKNYVSGQSLAEEIVETWEPVYEEERFMNMEIGNPKVPITIYENGNIEQSGRHPFVTTVEAIGVIVDALNCEKRTIVSYPVNVHSVWIGCKEEGVEVTLKELENVVKEYINLTMGKEY